MTTCEIKQVGFGKIPRFEASVRMHFYSSDRIGWYRVEITAMESSEEAARLSAKSLVEQAQAACMVASVEFNRVGEARDATEG